MAVHWEAATAGSEGTVASAGHGAWEVLMGISLGMGGGGQGREQVVCCCRQAGGMSSVLSENHQWVVPTDTLSAGAAAAGPWHCDADLSSTPW